MVDLELFKCYNCGEFFTFPEFVEKREPNVVRYIPVCPHCKKNINEIAKDR